LSPTVETTNSNNICVPSCNECGHPFIRAGNLKRHINSETCTKAIFKRKKQTSTIYDTTKAQKDALTDSITVIEQKHSETMEILNTKLVSTEEERKIISSISASASKLNKPQKTAKRFTEIQKQVMIQCYNVGVNSKAKRFTAEMCQKEMAKHPEIGRENTLTETQIKSFWSCHHRKILKHTTGTSKGK